MKDFKIRIVILVAAAVLAIVAVLMSTGSFNKVEKNIETDFVVGSADKDSVLVDDGTYLYYNDKDGNVMRLNPYDVKNPSVWAENKEILDVTKTEILLRDKDGVYAFNKDEGIDESYDIKSDNIQVTVDGIYYKNKDGNVVKIDRETKEETVIISFDTKKFLVYENMLVCTIKDNPGIIIYDLVTFNVTAQEIETEIEDFYLTGEGMIYYSTKDSKLKYISLVGGQTGVSKFGKTDKYAFCKGAFFEVKKDKLLVNTEELY